MQAKTLQLEGRQAGKEPFCLGLVLNCSPVTKHIKCHRWIWVINIINHSLDQKWCFVLMLYLVLIYFFPRNRFFHFLDWMFTSSLQPSLVYLSHTLSFTTSGWSQHVWHSFGTKVWFKKLLHMFYNHFQKIWNDRFLFLNYMPYL